MSGGFDTRYIADTQARLKTILGPAYSAYVQRYSWLMPTACSVDAERPQPSDIPREPSEP